MAEAPSERCGWLAHCRDPAGAAAACPQASAPHLRPALGLGQRASRCSDRRLVGSTMPPCSSPVDCRHQLSARFDGSLALQALRQCVPRHQCHVCSANEVSQMCGPWSIVAAEAPSRHGPTGTRPAASSQVDGEGYE